MFIRCFSVDILPDSTASITWNDDFFVSFVNAFRRFRSDRKYATYAEMVRTSSATVTLHDTCKKYDSERNGFAIFPDSYRLDIFIRLCKCNHSVQKIQDDIVKFHNLLCMSYTLSRKQIYGNSI